MGARCVWAKDLLSNFFGGLMLYMDRPMAPGDWVRSPDKDIEGTVEEIGWRLTRIRTFSKRPIYVPNSVFSTITVENPSRMTNRRINETIGIRYDDFGQMEAITEDVKQMLIDHPAIDETMTLMVNFNAFGASSLDFFIYCFTHTTVWTEFHEIKQDVLLRSPLTDRARRTLEEYLRCGILAAGFARVRCGDCGHEQLLAFSCQLRGVCPSCQQKRAEILCRFVIDEVIQPVGHRQLVFVLPRHLRRPFYKDRKLLTGLCRSAVEATHAFYRAGLGRADLRVGMVVVPQRFGDRVNPNIHLHALATDGAFDRDGLFHPMPFDLQGDIEVLERLFARRVLDLMVRRKRLSVRLRDEMLGWEHSGFSVDGSVRVAVGDYGRLRRLVRYLARPAVSAERVSYDRSNGTVTVRSSKKVQGVRPVVAQYDALTFLSLLALQVPPPGVHMVRYYGHYSVRSRAERRKKAREGTAGIRSEKPPPASERRRRWSEVIRLVFEVDPLRCDKCGGEMKFVSFISTVQDQVIRRILEHLVVSTVVPRAHGPPEWVVKCERNDQTAPCREEEDYSQAPLGWDEWEPA